MRDWFRAQYGEGMFILLGFVIWLFGAGVVIGFMSKNNPYADIEFIGLCAVFWFIAMPIWVAFRFGRLIFDFLG